MGKRGRHGEHSHAKACPRHVSRGAWEYQARHRADVEDLGEQRGVRSAVRQRRPRHRAPIDVKVALGRILRDEENLQPLAAVTKSIVCGGEERRRRAACWTPRSGKVKPDHLMGSNQRSSEAVRGNPRSSEVISGQREARSPSAREVISGHQRSSAVITSIPSSASSIEIEASSPPAATSALGVDCERAAMRRWRSCAVIWPLASREYASRTCGERAPW